MAGLLEGRGCTYDERETPESTGLAAPSQLALDLPARIALGDVAPLVVQFLASCERELDLHAAVLEVHPRRHDGHALLAHLSIQSVDLAPVQQELARAFRIVVGAVPLHVLTDVDAVEPRLAAFHVGVRALERRLPLAQRLHLRAGEHEAGLDAVAEVVVVTRAP